MDGSIRLRAFAGFIAPYAIIERQVERYHDQRGLHEGNIHHIPITDRDS